MLNKIKLLLNQIERLNDITELRQDKLDSLVTPVFRAASGIERGYVEEVHILKDTISIGYKFRWDDYVEYFEIPKKIFEAENPTKSATEWRNRSRAQKKAKEKAALRKELTERLAKLDEEVENEMD